MGRQDASRQGEDLTSRSTTQATTRRLLRAPRVACRRALAALGVLAMLAMPLAS